MNIDDTSDDMSSELQFLSPSPTPSEKPFLETRMMCVCIMVGVVQ